MHDNSPSTYACSAKDSDRLVCSDLQIIDNKIPRITLLYLFLDSSSETSPKPQIHKTLICYYILYFLKNFQVDHGLRFYAYHRLGLLPKLTAAQATAVVPLGSFERTLNMSIRWIRVLTVVLEDMSTKPSFTPSICFEPEKSAKLVHNTRNVVAPPPTPTKNKTTPDDQRVRHGCPRFSLVSLAPKRDADRGN